MIVDQIFTNGSGVFFEPFEIPLLSDPAPVFCDRQLKDSPEFAKVFYRGASMLRAFQDWAKFAVPEAHV